MITEAGLLEKNVSSALHNGKLYFDIQQIREAYPNTKFPPEKIIQVSFDGLSKEGIQVENIQEMTEFDLKILQTLNFNPKK